MSPFPVCFRLLFDFLILSFTAKVANCAIGVKSSKVLSTFPSKYGTGKPACAIIRVYPSAGEFSSFAAATVPAAPATLVGIKFTSGIYFSSVERKSLPAVSVPPPGGKGIT